MKNKTITSANIIISGDIYVDNYEQGQLGRQSCFSDNINIDATKLASNLYIHDCISNYLEYNFNYSKFNINNAVNIDDTLHYSIMINENEEYPSEDEVEIWKKGEIDLYCIDFTFKLEVCTKVTNVVPIKL